MEIQTTPPRSGFWLPRLGLVQRLRLVFALIVLVIGAAVAMALWQFKSLGDEQSNLLRDSVPTLVRTQIVERALYDLVVVLGQIETVSDQDALQPLQKTVNARFEGARLSVSGLSRVPEHRDQVEEILRRMSRLENGIHANFAIKRGLFRTEDNLRTLHRKLIDERDRIRALTEELASDASVLMKSSVSDVVERGQGNARVAIDQLYERTRNVGLIAQLSLELETLINFVDQLEKNVSGEKLENAREFLKIRMRGASQSLADVPESDVRTELLDRIVKMRSIIFADAGILAELEQYAGRTRDLVRQNEVESVVVRNITEATERLTASAHNQLMKAGQTTRLTTKRLITILAIAAICVAVIVSLTIIVIVERQINKRIGLLERSVLRIASGDIDHVTQVDGHDELGRMADALSVFRSNAKELVRSNAELETFAYAAAHDLRTPLQAICDLTSWTLEDTENVLSDDSRENLGLLQIRADRLSGLLDDLLQYARVDASVSEATEFDLRDLVSETASMIDPSSAFKVVHKWDGPNIETYYRPLQKILLTLIGNTMKHHGSASGNIEITSVIRDGRLVINYSDDGPGISPEFNTRVFELFQTLKPKDELEGSGLGLAISKKVVEHFEGSIMVADAPGPLGGAMFVFDFPVLSIVETAQAA